MIAARLLRGVVQLILFYPLRWAVQWLPRRVALKLGTLLASLHMLWITDSLKRQIREGIQLVQPQSLSARELRRLVRRNLVTRYKHLMDSFLYQRLDEGSIDRLIPNIEGRHHLDRALTTGRGVILLASHFGSFGMLIAGLMFRGYRLHQILTLAPQSPYRSWRGLERMIMKAKLGCWSIEKSSFIFWKPGMYLRPLYRKLFQGEVLVLYGDGARGQRFATVDFMGHPLSLATGPFRIAAKRQVPLIPAFIIREADDRHRIIVEPPILLNDVAPATIHKGANQYASLLSHYVCLYPDHWFSWARLRKTPGKDGHMLALARGEVDLSDFYSTERWTEE